MATYSLSDLASKSLRLPNLYGPDEAITGEDQADAEEMCEALVETLTEFGVHIPNGSVNAVPGAWYIPLANFMGLYLLQGYGGEPPSPEALSGALTPLYKLSAKPSTGATMQAEYF